MATMGRCRLCRNEAELQDSHFIPQAAYRLVRGEGKNPHPLVVQSNKVMQTSVQMRAHMFCRDCEQRFHLGGEDTFFRYCHREFEGFKLLAMLKTTLPVLENANVAVYVVPSTDDVVVEQIGYFGISLFWKSSIHAWNDGTRPVASISLGPYQERLRRFLLGEEPFPTDAALVVEASDENNRLIRAFGSPGTMKKQTNHVHWIHICGIRFNLMVGQRLPPELKRLCAFKPSPKIVLVSKNEESDMATLYRDLLVTLAEKATP
jgi:hypothetical protein